MENNIRRLMRMLLARAIVIKIMTKGPSYLPRRFKRFFSRFSKTYEGFYKETLSTISEDIELNTHFGFRICVNYTDFVEREIALGTFEKEYVDLFYSTINSGDIVLDIGANVGYFTLIAAKKVGSEGKVYAFEPVERNYKRLERNLEINDTRNVKTFNFGLSDREEVLPMVIPEGNFGESTIGEKNFTALVKGQKTKNRRIKAKFFAFDYFNRIEEISNVNVIKVDVEGAELKVLNGMKKFLAINNPVLFIEIVPEMIEQNGGNVGELVQLFKDVKFTSIYNFSQKKALNLKNDLPTIAAWLKSSSGNFVLIKARELSE